MSPGSQKFLNDALTKVHGVFFPIDYQDRRSSGQKGVHSLKINRQHIAKIFCPSFSYYWRNFNHWVVDIGRNDNPAVAVPVKPHPEKLRVLVTVKFKIASHEKITESIGGPSDPSSAIGDIAPPMVAHRTLLSNLLTVRS